MVCTRFCYKKSPDHHISKHSSTGSTGFVKCFHIVVYFVHFESVWSNVHQRKNNNIFTGFNVFSKVLNVRFGQVSQIFDLLLLTTSLLIVVMTLLIQEEWIWRQTTIKHHNLKLTLNLLNFLNGLIHLHFWNCPLTILGISGWEFDVGQQQYRAGQKVRLHAFV